MKKFLRKILIFKILLFAILSGMFAFLYYRKQNEVVKIPKRNIVIGDSNTRWSVDDKILKGYSNYSTGGETMMFAYTKLKILDKYNKIDTLLLSFSPHNLINNMWWDDSQGSSINNRMPAFYQNFTLENHLDLLKTIPKNYLQSLSKIGSNEASALFSPNKEDPMFRFGSYIPATLNETQIKKTLYPDNMPKITEIEVKYLKKIISECKAKNIKLILIQPPKNYLRPDYKYYDHQEFYEFYYKNFRDIDFLDFSKLQLPPHAYWDIMHVDIVGSKVFSRYLQDHGIKNLLNSEFNLKNNTRK